MGYMNKGKQKNFTLPPQLAAKWEAFQSPGSKESSKNGRGALFLYMIMPVDVRDLACKFACVEDLEQAYIDFFCEIQQSQKDVHLARDLLARAQAREAKPRRKKIGKTAKSV